MPLTFSVIDELSPNSHIKRNSIKYFSARKLTLLTVVTALSIIYLNKVCSVQNFSNMRLNLGLNSEGLVVSTI